MVSNLGYGRSSPWELPVEYLQQSYPSGLEDLQILFKGILSPDLYSKVDPSYCLFLPYAGLYE